MFNNKAEISQPKSNQGKNIAPSLLSSDLVINGNLESSGDMQVDGTIEGDIKSLKLTVSASAVVRGTIEAEQVTIAGSVTGQIKAKQVTLNKGARVIADLIQDRLTIEPGAFFEGNCRRFPSDDEKSTPQIEYAKPTKSNGKVSAKGAIIPS